MGIADRVDFEGFQKDVNSYYVYAKATLLTSLYEGFPNCLIESIVLGTPVVSFDCQSGPNEIIKNGINGYLVKYKDINDLKKQLHSVISHNFNIKKMRLTVEKHHINNIIKNYEGILAEFN